MSAPTTSPGSDDGRFLSAGGRRQALLRWILALLGASAFVGLCGLVFYRFEERQLRDRLDREFSTIAELKRDQILHWRTERLGDAGALSERSAYATHFIEMLRRPTPEARRRSLGEFDSLRRYYGYASIVLTDPAGGVRLRSASDASDSGDRTALSPEAHAAIESALRSGLPVLSDLHLVAVEAGESKACMDVVAPIILRRERGRGEAIGAVVMEIDPTLSLFSIIQSWPVPSRSAEALLVRREGDDVLFLNELRHRKGTALRLRIPLVREDLPAAQAVRGVVGSVEGRDYRGISTVGSVLSIPGTPWSLVVKEDRDEAFADTRAYAFRIVGVMFAVAVTLAAAATAVWERRNRMGIQALRASEARNLWLSRAVEQSPASVAITNLDGEIAYVNRRFTEVTGYAYEEAIGKNPRILKSGEMPPEGYDRLWETIRSGNEWRGEFHNKRKDGSLYWEVASISAVRDATGRITNYLAVKEEITEMKRLQAELRVACEAAESASRAKSDFLARMSHELRTPLNSVIGFAHVLLRNKTGAFAAHDLMLLGRIAENGKHLLGLINQILDIAKIEAQKIEVVRTPVDVAALVREVTGLLQGQAHGKSVELRDEAPGGLERVETDSALLKQILINLVGNALKFTAHGSVTVRVPSDGARPVGIEVVDTGIGISAEKRTAIFEAFEQADASTARTYGGTGLGLSISRSLCEIMGCRLEVESEVGRGSTFRVVFPGGGAAPAGSA